MQYPELRLRRLRRTPALRRMVRETHLSPADFVLPLFVCPGSGVDQPVGSMPGVSRQSVDRIVETCRATFDEGVPAVILFGIPEDKDAVGSSSWHEHGIVQQALRAVKQAVPELVLIADVCFCEYTDHGHCGVLDGETVDNDATLETWRRQAVSHAQAGADVVAPSDMMDGRVGGIRDGLDEAGLAETSHPLLRRQVRLRLLRPVPRGRRLDAAVRRPPLATRWTRPTAARRCARSSSTSQEGADMLMVKPALRLPRRARRSAPALRPAARRLPRHAASTRCSRPPPPTAGSTTTGSMMESLLAIKRAGADLIITYAAREACGAARARVGGVSCRRAVPTRLRACCPGGVSSPVRAFSGVGGDPVFIRSARRRLARGRGRQRYVDYIGGYGPLILGHGDPAGASRRSSAAADRGTVFGAPTSREVELGERVIAAHAVARARAVRQLGHRGDDERHAPGARRHRPREARQVHRLLPRPRRSVPRAAGSGARRSACRRPRACRRR